MTVAVLDCIYSFYCPSYFDDTLGQVHIIPFQCTDFSYAHSCGETDIYADIAWSQMSTEVLEYFPMVDKVQHFHPVTVRAGGESYIPFTIIAGIHSCSEFHYHFQNHEDILYAFLAQSLREFSQHKILHIGFCNIHLLSECRKDVNFKDKCVG